MAIGIGNTIFNLFKPVDLSILITWLSPLHGPSMFAIKMKIYGLSIINPALSLLMEHLVIGQRQKAPNVSALHWSPHGSLVSRNHEGSTFTENHRNKLYY